MAMSRHRWTTLVFFVAATAVVGILAKGLLLDPKRVPSTMVDKPAEAFTLELLQGKDLQPSFSQGKIELAALKGRPVVLNFWASWCVSCREEAREFQTFWEKHREEGVIVLGVAIQDTPEAALEFARAFGKTYALGLDTDGKAAIGYGVTGVPETFFIDRQGIVA